MQKSEILKGVPIAVGGGSIAGCGIATLLLHLGADVRVFERSPRPLEGRGAGIVLPEPFIQQCIELNLFDVDIPRLDVLSRSFIVKDQTASNDSRTIWTQPSFSVSALNWADIYQNLRKRIPDHCYHPGEAIREIKSNENTCQFETSKGNHYQVDLLIAADGIESTIRKQILPKVTSAYAHYVAWRGIVNATNIVQQKEFFQQIPYYVFPKGHLLMYCIPALNFKTTGDKLLNWVMYEDLGEASLADLLIDNNGHQRSISLPPGSLTSEHIKHLHEFSKQSLPSPIAEIICQTEKPFLQAVFDLQVTDYVKNRICFIGDAASVLRPHTASGALKALQDCIGLAQTFEQHQGGALFSLLNAWNQSQLAHAEQQVLLAKSMGEALVTHSPIWNKMDETLMNEWWKKVMSGKKWYATK